MSTALVAFLGLLASAMYAQSTPQAIPYIHTIAAGGGGVAYTPTAKAGNATPPNHGVAPGDGYLATDPSVQFKAPTGIAVDGLGNLYITDSAGWIRRVDAATGNITTFAGGIASGNSNGICNTSVPTALSSIGDGCPANEAYVNSVQGIGIDPRNGDIYLADASANRIRKIDHASYLISTVAGTGTKAPSAPADSPIATGMLNSPRSVAVDKYGNIYIGEGGSNTYDVRAAVICDPSTGACNGPLKDQIVTVVNTTHAKNCAAVPTASTAGAATTGMQKDISFDKDGNLYIADASCNYVYKVAVNPATKIVDSNSSFSIVAGNGLNSGGTTGYQLATTAAIAAGSVKVDLNGNLYIGESQATFPVGSRVWFYDASTGYVHAIFGGGTAGDCYGVVGSGTPPYNGCDGIHSAGTMNGNSVALDPWGNLYISDIKNFYIHKLSLGTNAPFTTTIPAGNANAFLHFGVADGLASLDASLAPDFTITQGACTVNATGDNTQDCSATIACQTGACSDPSNILYQSVTVNSSLGKSAQMFLSNQAFPTCQPPKTSDQYAPLTGSSVNITLTGQLGIGCTAIESNPTTPHVLTYEIVGTGPSNGTLTGSGSSLTYTPNNPSSPLPDSFKFKAVDNGAWQGSAVFYDGGNSSVTLPATTPLSSAAATATIVVLPAAQNQTVSTFANTDTPITLTATGNGTLQYTVTTPPAGSLTGSGANLSYISANVGDDSFQFTVSNEAGASVQSGTVSIHVAAEQVPVPNDQTLQVNYPASKAIKLTAVGSRTITYVVTVQPAHGSLTCSNSDCTYTPTTGFTDGYDSFKFTATNNLGTSPAPGTVTIHVVTPPVALDQALSVVQNIPTPITLAVSGGGTMTYTLMPNPDPNPPSGLAGMGPFHGQLTGTAPNLIYTGEAQYTGSDYFWFMVNNGLDSNIAVVSITVTHAKPAPTPSAVSVKYNTSAPITLTATGLGTITYNITTQPAHGTLIGSGSTWTYTPNLNFAGTDAIYYTASNDGGTSDPAKLPITVAGDFLWAPASPGGDSLTVSLGQTASYNLLISGWTGATDTVTFSCAGAPMPCAVTPNPATLNGTTGVPVTVSVVTTKPQTAGGFMSVPGTPGGWPGMLMLAIAGLAAIFLAARNRKLQWRFAGACAALLLAIGLSSCGVNQGKAWTTPSGVYNLTVTATAGSVTKAYTITLNVNN
jgi:sugar lactone lactonase YvrE